MNQMHSDEPEDFPMDIDLVDVDDMEPGTAGTMPP